MCAYTFTVFVSLFQLLPAAPYRILDLGGSTAVAGLFLGVLTVSCAAAAPFTGSLGDRFGHRRVLIGVSVALALVTASYAFITSYRLLFVVVVGHGLFWSALLSASGAYMTATIPASRRGEGLGYWGFASVGAFAIAPAIGFWMYGFGWTALVVEMTALHAVLAAIAWRLPADDASDAAERHREHRAGRSRLALVEWRVLVLSVSLALVSYGYGGLTSFAALYADALRLSPRSLFFIAMAVAILAGRVALGRAIDRRGHRRILLPSLILAPMGLGLLVLATGVPTFVAAALLFGAGFGVMWPAYTTFVMSRVPDWRRGAAFGAMIAAFDTGIATGSSTMGWLVQHLGFRLAFATAAALAALALPTFLVLERRFASRIA